MRKLESSLNTVLKDKNVKSIMLELNTESYFETNIKTIKILQKKGFGGVVYVSIQRPFKNISSTLKKQRISIKNMLFIDVASAVSNEAREKYKECVHISPKLDVDELIKAIYASAEKIKGKKFIFIDSLTTFALYKPISETLRFTEFLMQLVKGEKNTVLILNVAKDLSQKKFIQNVIVHADKIIEVKT
ncbi:hypothetical protein COV11_02560 [Candidatus Woesearchaeota archaeon CG10_big_fil_rev_8_21_14_0_10_30_7]|nr:MAG: hypothetical protein COV11_02560 [Candidatus Woesearchaeota archaeon CG10_big_fil_rev_8_21_14_0_10_30_7]